MVNKSNTAPTVSPLSPTTSMVVSSTEQLTFSWTRAFTDCSSVHYNILASNCGSCPTTINHTNVTCTDAPTNGGVCIFAIQTVICGGVLEIQTSLIIIISELQWHMHLMVCNGT